MKEIRLSKLELRDFKGMTFSLPANGHDVNVFGRNGTGKTTLADAFSWLLFDKDSLGRSDFEIKNLDEQGEVAHGLEHGVQAEILIDNAPMSLKKIYKEIWTKKRGSAQAVLTGNTTDYFINNIPCQKKDYVNRINEVFGEENNFRLLTTPTAFPALHWQKQRNLLLEVCGDISDTDVIASDEKLYPITEMLKAVPGSKKPFDDLKALITSRRTEINKELQNIPVRIDEQRRSLPDIEGLNRKQIQSDIADQEEQLNASKLSLKGVDTGGAIAELSKMLSIVNSDIHKIEDEHVNKMSIERTKLRTEIENIDTALRTHKRRVSETEEEVARRIKHAADLDASLESLRLQWNIIDEEQFTDTTAQVCAACGQNLPADQVQAARDKALAAFNLSKAERLSATEKKGQSAKDRRISEGQHIERLTEEKASIERLIPSLQNERESLNDKLNSYQVSATLPGVAELRKEKADIEAEIEKEKQGVAKNAESIRADIVSYEANIKALKEREDRFGRRETGEKRIKTLMDDEKKLSVEFEKLEKELYLCEQFIKTKVSMLTERINSKFEMIRFKLFDVQVNGGISECCEITVNGIPFNSGLNSGARTNGGLDAVKTLQKHFGLAPVVFVDNAESIVDLLPMDCQVVRLVVSEADEKLRVETLRQGGLF